MLYCEKHEIDIKNYEDLEYYYDALLLEMKTVNCICDIYQMKNEKWKKVWTRKWKNVWKRK